MTLTCAALACAAGEPAGPALVRDIRAATAGANPVALASLGPAVFFAATEPATGTELWTTDGTPGGTRLVMDIAPGTAGSQPHDLTRAGSRIFFAAWDPASGFALWRTDGTASGTRPILALDPSRLMGAGETLFFWANDGIHGTELWASDGTTAGTRLVADLTPGSWSSMPGPCAVAGTRLFFWLNSPAGGSELWISNGTTGGTTFLGVFFSMPHQYALATVGDTLFFTANDGRTGRELWKSDGTPAGTVLVRDIRPGAGESDPFSLTGVGGNLFFSANDDLHGRELWRSDGTVAGTSLVRDIRPGSASGLESDGRPQVVGAAGTAFLRADDGIAGTELWRSDGTPAGTQLVADLTPGTSGSAIEDLTASGGRLFFVTAGARGRTLWASDGTAGGTVPVADFPAAAPYDDPIGDIVDAAGTLYFVADDGAAGREVWRSDGTPGGTRIAGDVNTAPVGSAPERLTRLGETLVLVADDGVHGPEPWRSDGSSSGTRLLAETFPGRFAPYGVAPRELTAVGTTLFFVAPHPDLGVELWRSDGTAAGTAVVRDIVPGSGSSEPGELAAVGGALYFGTSGSGCELWRSDGTEAGTVRVARLASSYYRCLDHLTNVHGTLYFVESDETAGAELWRSDGTAAGTVRVADVRPGAGGANPEQLTAAPDALYFVADDGVHGLEVWRSDGSAAGTSLVADIRPDGSSSPGDLTVVGNTLYFAADDGVHGRELWRSDGTPAGTRLVADLEPGAGSSWPGPLLNLRGTLAFWADVPGLGRELWRSDGTAAGTVLVADVFPGPGGSLDWAAAGAVTAINGVLFFPAADGVAGEELWRSDGTPAGTRLVGDVRAGTAGSEPSEPTAAGGWVFFAADDGVHGRELWKVAAPALLPPRLDPPTEAMVAGAANVLRGAAFSPGSVVQVFVATSTGPVAYGPYPATGRGFDWVSFVLPAGAAAGPCAPHVCLGNGFAAVQVINTDEGFLASNVVGALLLGDAAAGFPSITRINTLPLAPPELGVGLAHVDTAVPQGFGITVEGTGFDEPVVNLFTAAGNVGPLAPRPGWTSTRLIVPIPAGAPTGPGTFQVVNGRTYRASNAVAAAIGRPLSVAAVSVAGPTIVVTGTGFSPVSVINLFNLQGGGVVNLGGFGPGGVARLPLTIVSDTQFTFARPAGAAAGPAFVQVLNPPFIPFASSGNDPDGAFTMPPPAPLVTGPATEDAPAAGAGAAAARGRRDWAGPRRATAEVVRWTRAAGATIDGPTLRLAAAPRAAPPPASAGPGAVGAGPAGEASGPAAPWRAGARSTRALLAGDGHVAWTVPGDAGAVAFGLSTDDNDGTLADIDHAWRLDAATRELLVYERGVRQAQLGTWAAGDRLRVAVRDGRVEYWRNGALAWTSARAPRYPLAADASLGAPGAAIGGVRLAGRLGTVVDWAPAPGAVATSMAVTLERGAAGPRVVGAACDTARGGSHFVGTETDDAVAPSLRHGAGARCPGPAGAGDGPWEVSAALRGAAGIGIGAGGCDYCIARHGDTVQVQHAGVGRGTWPSVPAARYRVEIDATGLVRYWAGDALLDEAPLAAAAPLAVRGWLGAPGAAISGAAVTGARDR